MNNQLDFGTIVDQIIQKDERYKKGAYYFVREALEFTVKDLLVVDHELESQHISGKKLLDGIKRYALQQYGPMALTLLTDWNVKTCKDFGNIVFNMVDNGILGKTDQDSIKDFEDGYDFKEVFSKPYEHKGAKK